MPGTPAQEDQYATGEDAPALRQAAAVILMDRRGLMHLVLGAPGNVAFEALDILGRVQSQMAGIGTHETAR